MDKKVSMTEGTIWRQIVKFTLPLIGGNLLQQLYSAFDSIIVGRYIGSAALAAIGACDPAINILLGLCVGLAAGTGVLVSRHYGAKDYESLKITVQSIVFLSGIIGILLTILGMLFVPVYVKILKFPADVKDYAFLYLIIYFAGMIFRVVFNMLSGVMNAVGNSRRTLVYLSITSLLNIVLDYLFIAVFQWGIAGAAVATVLSEGISAALVFRFLCRIKDVYKIELDGMKLRKNICTELIRISMPTGMQNVVRAFANMVVQISINSFGTAAIAGYAIYLKIDMINWLPAMSLGITATTFAGQNMGAKQYKRIQSGVKSQVLLSVIYTAFTAVFLLGFSENLLGIFTNDLEVIRYGKEAIWWFTPFYAAYASMMVFSGTLCGMGKTFHSMLVNFYSLCVFRIVGSIVVNMGEPTFAKIMAIYPLSWFLGVGLGAFWLKTKMGVIRENERAVEK